MMKLKKNQLLKKKPKKHVLTKLTRKTHDSVHEIVIIS
jgi:hypothetical protein